MDEHAETRAPDASRISGGFGPTSPSSGAAGGAFQSRAASAGVMLGSGSGVGGFTPEGVPLRIGHYQIQQLLGSGGMGAVYRALQEQPRRTVALKVIQGGLASPSALRRFEYESQLLARLRHPGIAQIFEAGVHMEGALAVPYFAMEYVPGATTLTAFAAAKKLSTRERLNLFTQVCDAVQHGHQKGIIHRDLKPANILVDSGGQPKIIDYGVARGADADMADAMLQTHVGQLVGTMQYMSPEQCGGDPANVDVRSDVYALGVILYELLTGKTPYDLAGMTLPEATKVVCERMPERPSAVVSNLRGDLETIALKSLEKEREKRYQSVSDLSADVTRYLKNEPILARPVGPLGRTIRWLRRRRDVAVAGGIGLALVIVVVAVMTTRIVQEVRRTAAALKQSEQNLRAARQNFELVRKLVEFGEFDGTRRIEGGKADIEQLLDGAEADITARPPELAATEADFREILGTGYMAVRAYAKAKKNFDRTLEIREKMYPDPSPELASALHNLAANLFRYEEYDQAETLYQRSLTMRRQLTKGKGDDKDVAMSLNHLGVVEEKRGRLDVAEQYHKQALSIRERLYGPQHIDVAASLNNLAAVYLAKEDLSLAEQMTRRSLEMVTRLKGEESAEAAYASTNLARCLLMMGKTAEAVPLCEKAAAIRQRLYSDDDPRTAQSKSTLARALLMEDAGSKGDRLTRAEQLARSAVTALRRKSGEMSSETGSAMLVLGEVLVAAGKPAEAEPILKQSLEIARGRKVKSTLEVADREGAYGQCLVMLGKVNEGEQLLVGSTSVIRASRGDTSPRTTPALRRMVDLYRAKGDAARTDEFERLAKATTGK